MADPDLSNDNTRQPQGEDKPLGESLLGDSDSGGRAGQGGMVDLAEDDEEEDEPGETDDLAVADDDENRQDNGVS
jgi:hypothetical protein